MDASTSAELLETRLAQVFLSELLEPRSPTTTYAEGDPTQVDIVLLDPEDLSDDYETYELAYPPVSDLDTTMPIARMRDATQDQVATAEFVRPAPDPSTRDTTQDHIVTVEFVRPPDPLDPKTAPFEKSAPYDMIEMQFPREAPPAGLSISLDALVPAKQDAMVPAKQSTSLEWFAETDVVFEDEREPFYAEPQHSSHKPFVVFIVLTCALAIGVSVALFVL